MSDFLTILTVAVAAALASPAAGLLTIWRKPTSMFMSVSLGLAAGVLLGTISFKMLPEARQYGGLALAVIGFVIGLAAIYAFDLFVHRGRVAGEKSEQYKAVQQYHRRHRPRGNKVTVLAGGTSAEEIVEGLSIGVGAALQPSLGLLIAVSIAADNFAEGLSIGEMVRSDEGKNRQGVSRRILLWTSIVGAALLGSTLVGWLALHWLPHAWLGVLLAFGAGGMFYLVAADIVTEGEERHYQQSSTLAAAGGFVFAFVLAQLL